MPTALVSRLQKKTATLSNILTQVPVTIIIPSTFQKTITQHAKALCVTHALYVGISLRIGIYVYI